MQGALQRGKDVVEYSAFLLLEVMVMDRLLENYNCVVTGGSRGIGKAIAKAFVMQGANVVITYVSNNASAEQTVKELEQYGTKVFAFKSDAGNENDVRNLAEFVKEKLAYINVLVNNAGTVGRECPTKDLPVEEWDKVINTDLRGVFLNTKYFIPLFNVSSTGKIINISSELSKKGRANYIHYTAAKGAVNSMTRSLALELAPHILVNTLAPGPIETDMILKDMEAEWVEKEKQIPLKKLGTVEDISATAVLLASKYGEFYCGQFISPNGGAVFN